MKKNLSFVFTIIFCYLPFLSIEAQSVVQKLTFEALTEGDYTKWEKAVLYIEKNKDLSKIENLEELIHCYYGLASALIARKMEKQASEVVKKGKKITENLLKKDPENALAMNYMGDFVGYEIAMNKMKAIILGKSCRKYLDKAYELEPDNPQILFDRGNSLYYPPKIFGGDKKEALKYYQQAIAALEKQDKAKMNWVYLQLHVVQGHCYELLGNDSLAEKSYLKVLRISPDFHVVKNELYPNLKNRMNGNSRITAKEKDYTL
ncbi:MAG: tetratricopeptide repeat protein [Paludibacteraceae bacterium]